MLFILYISFIFRLKRMDFNLNMTLSGYKYISYHANASNTSHWYVVQIQRNSFRYQKASCELDDAIHIRDSILAMFGEFI